ncbi:MAG: phospholipid-binding protein [marine bacterium B5-7]|nr:MAG: phospholipid-binding protein [marine bacterium B5-7]
MKTSLLCRLLLPITFAAGLTGCFGPFVAGASVGAAGTAVVYDRRSIDTIKQDQTVAYNIENKLYADDTPTKEAHIGAYAYNGVVLLAGQAPDQAAKKYATQIAQKTENVRRVYNEVVIGPNSDTSTRANDSWITTKIKTELLAQKHLKSGQFKVITESGVVFIVGKASHEQADMAATIASRVSGVTRVVKIIEYMKTTVTPPKEAPLPGDDTTN